MYNRERVEQCASGLLRLLLLRVLRLLLLHLRLEHFGHFVLGRERTHSRV